MITLIGNAPISSLYDTGSFADFLIWIQKNRIYQFDIETSVTERWNDKTLISLQFGNMDDTEQWFLQWSYLSLEEKQHLKIILENKQSIKLIHNALFEATVLLNYEIVIENVYDTMLVDKILDGGRHIEGFALSDLTERYLGFRLDKTEQTTFGDDILTEAKILYGISDVRYLGAIYRMQIPFLNHTDQDWVAALENEVVLAYAEMTFNGMDFDVEKWRENIALAEPVINKAKEVLDGWLLKEPFFTKAKTLKYISDQDEVEIKWTSPKQRGSLLKLLFPEVPGGSKGVVKKYSKSLTNITDKKLLEDYMSGNYILLEQLLLQSYRDELIAMSLLIPAYTPRVNWNSPDQALPLFNLVFPRLKNLSADALDKLSHPLINDLREYKDNLKLITTYGEMFITKHLNSDGKIRPNVNQIVSTGRISVRKPNIQNIPVKEEVGARYRECFIAPPGWSVIGADMSSQELCIAAFLSKDETWLRALANNEDLHSVAAELVFSEEWKAGAEETCEYYHDNAHQKCSCKKHKTMRGEVKTINYMLVYGGSDMKLAGMIGKSKQYAAELIKLYFKTFPGIERLLDFLGEFGVKNGYSRTPAPFFRRRYFPQWEQNKDYIYAHLKKIEYNYELGSIERAAKNAPIQGEAANQIKLASCLIRWYIRDNNLQEQIKPTLQIHDENVSIAKDDIADFWVIKKKELMEEAALFSIPTGLLKADTARSKAWTK
jgi:DNA polymerase I-like protein with 3'-5' exonuclease and polymerase domains